MRSHREARGRMIMKGSLLSFVIIGPCSWFERVLICAIVSSVSDALCSLRALVSAANGCENESSSRRPGPAALGRKYSRARANESRWFA